MKTAPLNVVVEKTSKRIKLVQALVKLSLLACLILAVAGYYIQNNACITVAVVAAPLLILAAIFARWWRWWQHE